MTTGGFAVPAANGTRLPQHLKFPRVDRPPSDVRVYDAKTGRLKRIEPATFWPKLRAKNESKITVCLSRLS